MSVLGRVDILMMTNKKALPRSPTTPLNGSKVKPDPALMNFVGLEPQLSDKVNTTRVSTLGGDQTEGGRIKILTPVHEIGMVQNVDGRSLDLKPNSSFSRERDPLRHAKVKVEVSRTVEAVYREIAECTRGWSHHQSGL